MSFWPDADRFSFGDADANGQIALFDFGTGTVLQTFSLSDGSALLLATKEWLTPLGQSMWHVGILPDVSVTLPPDTMPLRPKTEREMSAGQLKESRDSQLLKAMEILLAIETRGNSD